MDEQEIKHDIIIFREISKSTNPSSYHSRDEKSIDAEDYIYDSSGGKNEIEEEPPTTKTHYDEEFKPGHYTSRPGKTYNKLQSKGKFKSKKVYKSSNNTMNQGKY